MKNDLPKDSGQGWAIIWSNDTLNVYESKEDAEHDYPKLPSGAVIKFIKWVAIEKE